MVNKLNYQQARRVRKSKFSTLFLDQLAQQDSVTSAIGKTISIKTQARMKGIKESFDPLNMVRFLTFGSKLGPALFGKLTGRKQKDIDYFTGRSKSVVGGMNTADKLKGHGQGGDSAGINEQLSKIYSFLKTSREDDIKLKEKSKNFEEELSLEKEKRHKELIATLDKLVKSISGGKPTAEKEDSSLFGDIFDKIKSLFVTMSILKDAIFDIAKQIGMKVGSALANAGTSLANAATAAAASGGLTVAAVGAAGAAITVGATNVLDNMTPEQRNQISADTGSDTALAAQALNSAKSKDELAEYDKSLTKFRKYIADAPLMTRAAALYSPAAAGNYLRNEAKVPKSELDEFEKFDIIPPAPTAVPVKKEINTPKAPAAMEFDAEGNVISAPVQSKEVKKIPETKSVPVAPAPKSAPVSSLTNNNITMAMDAAFTPAKESKSVVNNTVNNTSSKNKERPGLRPSQISVRNDEPTFMGLIINSTRVV